MARPARCGTKIKIKIIKNNNIKNNNINNNNIK